MPPERLPGCPVPPSIDRMVTRGVPVTLPDPLELEVPEANADLSSDLNRLCGMWDDLDCVDA
jgi:hypothetical protein